MPLNNPHPKEKLELQRAACRAGIVKASASWMLHDSHIDRMVKECYPDPPQPREITLNGYVYRVLDDVVQVKVDSGKWVESRHDVLSIRALYALLERPNA